jgi:hypothetical protein
MRTGRCIPERLVHITVKPAVQGGFLEDLAVSAAGGDLAAVRAPEADGDDRLAGEVHQEARGGGGETVDTHLPERGGGPAPMRAPVIDRAIHEVEDLPSQRLGVLLVLGQPGAGIGLRGPGRLLRAARRHQHQREHGSGRPDHQSIANSRLNTTSKLKVLARLRVSISSAIRFSLAGMPMIFSWAMRPISFRPCRLSIFQ